jgi:hypothetical protein
MNKKNQKRKLHHKMRSEYGLSKLKGGVHGKYATRFAAGMNLVLLSPDVA